MSDMLNAEDKQWLELKFDSLAERQERTEAKVDKVHDTLDVFVGKVASLEGENKAGAETMRRHTVQIGALAKVAGVALPE